MEKKAASGMMLTLLLVSMLTLTLGIPQVHARIVKIEWIDPTYYGYDAFFGREVVAYRSGSVAKIAVTVRNELFPPDTTMNVSAVKVGFDWGMSYASTEASPQDPFELSWWEAHAFNVSFTVPPTTVASDTVLHEFQIRVEHVDAQSNIVGSWVLYFSNFAVYPEPRTWTVDDDGPADFHTIQEAINAASPGDTIFVYNGTYYENVVINKSVSVIGEDKDIPVIDGSRGPYGSRVIDIKADSVLISGFTIQNGSHSNIMIWSNNCRIVGNKIANNTWMGGVYVQYGAYNIIQNNIFCNNHQAIYLYWGTSVNNNVTNNFIKNNGLGIFVWYSKSNVIVENTLSNNYEGMLFSWDSVNNFVSNNLITDNYCGIHLIESSFNSIYHNNFVNNTCQAQTTRSVNNVWDDGYPSGGNYWSDYTDVDERSGSNQDEPGNDGVWDHPYSVDLNNEDKFPLVNPWVPRTVGVQVGDWVKYSVETTGNRPGFPVDLNEVEWGKTIVKGVFGTIIDVELVWHLKNGTEITTMGTADVVTSGYPRPSSMTGLFVSKDLPTGATLYATYPYGAFPPSSKINETVLKEYLGVSRETNHIDATKHGTHIDAYWDKATGVLSEFTEDYLTYWSVHFKIIDTNLWISPVISAIIDIDPDTLNLRSVGTWITAYIQLPEGYNPEDIDATTILLNGTIPPVLDPKYEFVANPSEYLVDHDGDGILERMVKFDRAMVSELILSKDITNGYATLTITGQVDGTPFGGEDSVKVFLGGGGSGRRK